MTLAHLIKNVNTYLQVDFPAVENHPLLSQGDVGDVKIVVDDLIVTAANSARKWAELRHNFSCASVELDVTIPAGGYVDLDDVNGVSLKLLSGVYHKEASRPINVISRAEDWDRRYERDNVRPQNPITYSAHVLHSTYYEAKCVLSNNKLYFSNAMDKDIIVTVFGYRWLPDYSLQEIAYAITTQPELTDLRLSNAVDWDLGITTITIPYDIYAADGTKQFDAGDYAVTYHSTTDLTLTGQSLADFPVTGVMVPALYNNTGTASTDWFLKHGYAYMQWAAIVETNHLLQTFVPRQEGSLSPPEQMREREFAALREHDCYASDGGIYHQ
jgi:hypothetical protein